MSLHTHPLPDPALTHPVQYLINHKLQFILYTLDIAENKSTPVLSNIIRGARFDI